MIGSSRVEIVARISCDFGSRLGGWRRYHLGRRWGGTAVLYEVLQKAPSSYAGYQAPERLDQARIQAWKPSRAVDDTSSQLFKPWVSAGDKRQLQLCIGGPPDPNPKPSTLNPKP